MSKPPPIDAGRFPHYAALPAKLRKILEAAGTRGSAMADPIPADLREAIATAAGRSGVNHRSPAYEYLIKLLRYELGRLGDRPTPPGMTTTERAYVEAATTRALADARLLAGRPTPPQPAGRIELDPDGYTNPDDVGQAPDVVDLAAARRARSRPA